MRARIRAAPFLLSSVLIVAASLAFGCRAERRGTIRLPAHVLVILLDTVRADRLGAYGYERPVSPRIDALAREGVRFDHFYSNASWTLPAHASLFTGLLPARHGATQEHLALSAGPGTLAELFTAAGYATIGISSNPVVSSSNGLHRGFSDFVETFRPDVRRQVLSLYTDGRHPNHAALAEFLDETPPDRPFFAFVNFIEAHLPYAPPEPQRSAFLRDDYAADEISVATGLRMKDHYLAPAGLSERSLRLLSDLYDGEIAQLDGAVGAILDELETRGLADDTLVVVVSDHGENLGEGGQLAHVFSIQNTLLRIPLIVRFPDRARAGTRRTDVAEIRDLFTTLLAFASIPLNATDVGRDLFAPGAEGSKRPALAEYYLPRQVFSIFTGPELASGRERLDGFRQRLRSAQDDRHKLVWSSRGGLSLFEPARDPGEERNLIGDPDLADAVTRLAGPLAGLAVPTATPPAGDGSGGPAVGDGPGGFTDHVDDRDVLESLRQLGYVE